MVKIPRIGFAGLGSLGSALVQKMAQTRPDITVWNRTPKAYHQVKNTGVQFASSFEALCDNCDWLFSCVSDDVAFEAINQGIVTAPVRPAIHVSFSTCSPKAVKMMAACLENVGVALVNCPVLGRPDIVKAGKAGFLLSGPDSAVKQISATIEPLGRSPQYLGSRTERSAAMKLAMNFLIATTIGGLSEALAALSAQGIEGDELMETISCSPLASPALELFGQQILDRQYKNILFDLELAEKDVRYFQQLSGSAENHFITSAILQHIEQTKGVSKQSLDWSGLASHLFRAAAAQDS